jgi:hypothetical protein
MWTNNDHLFRGRADRLIAIARVLLAAAALLAVWIDPVQPDAHAELVFWILAAYAACAVGLVVVKYSLRMLRGLGIAAHVGDITVFTALLNLTGAPDSPFFVLLNFSLLGAALRWGWRGAAWTTAVLVALYAASAPLSAQFASADGFDINRFILRSTELVTPVWERMHGLNPPSRYGEVRRSQPTALLIHPSLGSR